MKLEDVKEFLYKRKGYLKFGAFKLSNILDADEQICYQALQEVRKEFKQYDKNKEFEYKREIKKSWGIDLNKNYISNNLSNNLSNNDIFKNAFKNHAEYPLTPKECFVKKSKTSKNVLVIGDLHLPFTLDGYLEHCIETYYKHNCNEVVFIGDIIDNHASSFHIPDADGYSAGYELKLAIQQVKEWYKAFPKATIIIGNHDRIIMRKAQASGLSKMWIKDYADVLGVPNWKFVESIEIDDVLYLHGEGGVARTRARRDLCSIVQGHLHTQASVDWIVGKNFKIFACQTGCGIDAKAYAMAYAKEFAKPAIGCAVVLEGKTVFNAMMEL
jgi:metallophosphoesterase superfamily enzyme